MILNSTFIENQFNYGQRLQAYALQEYIRQQFDIDVFTIDIRKPPYDFGDFEKNYMNLIHVSKLDEVNLNKADTLLVGGDQVFTKALVGSKSIIGQTFANRLKLVSYSGSGNGNLVNDKTNMNYNKVIQHLSKFKCLGFREKLDMDEFRKKFPHSKVATNIDPVFLFPVSHWEQMAEKPPFIENGQTFDFEYAIGNKPNSVVTLKDGVKKYFIFGNSSKSTINVNPCEFMWMVKNCRNFTTNSYHGNIFGIIFEKDLTFSDVREYKTNPKFMYGGTIRIDSLLDFLGAKVVNGKISNMDEVKQNIVKQRELAREWLRECLSCKDFKYTCYAKENSIRVKSASGGLSAVLARHFIDNGGVVYGAAYAEDFKSVKTIRVTTMEDYFNRISKSKYSYCEMPDVEEVRKDLESGKRVLFTGCPCQIVKLKQQLGREYENLTTVDLLCNGYSRPEFLERFVDEQEKLEGSRIVHMDMRPKQCFGLQLKFENGKEKVVENYVTKVFVCNKENYIEDCKNCNMHKEGHGVADLTIGDFWDFGKYKSSIGDGFSPIIGTNIAYINTEQGRVMFNTLKPQLEWRYLP